MAAKKCISEYPNRAKVAIRLVSLATIRNTLKPLELTCHLFRFFRILLYQVFCSIAFERQFRRQSSLAE